MAPRGGTRAARSISSVAASSAPTQQQQQATAVSGRRGLCSESFFACLGKRYPGNMYTVSFDTKKFEKTKSWVYITKPHRVGNKPFFLVSNK